MWMPSDRRDARRADELTDEQLDALMSEHLNNRRI
jgi:hypothetical protein